MIRMMLRLLWKIFSISVVSLVGNSGFIAGISFVFIFTGLWSWILGNLLYALVSVCDGCDYHSLIVPDGSLKDQGKKAT